MEPGCGDKPTDMSQKEIYEIGQVPPIGHVPKQMYAQVIRADRFGDPMHAFKVEKIAVPEMRSDEVLVYVMAAGVNFNNVWAALGSPIDVIGARQKAKYDPTFKIWGYETNWGSFAQFARVQAHQCMPKATHLTWEEAAGPTLVGATAYRMLMGWAPHVVRRGDVVLIWGASGGLGCMAIQIVKAEGGIPVGIVGDDRKIDFCMKLGAKGCINRKKYLHWGMMPHWKETAEYNKWAAECRALGKAIWDIVGERKNPRIVFEHPGEDTIPTSVFVCDTGGMVVICAGTTGYNAVADLRYLWMRQKRLQGSHFANDEQAYAFNQLVLDGKIDPCLAKTYKFDEIGECHQAMHENRAPEGKMVALVGAPKPGLKDLPL